MEMNQNRLNRQMAENEQDTGKDTLPSRADYHRDKKKPNTDQKGNTKKKNVSIPLVLLLILLMLPIIILSIINNGDRSKANPANSSSGEEVSFETEDSVMEAEPKKEEETDKSDKKKEQEKIKKEQAEKEKAEKEKAEKEKAEKEKAEKEKAEKEKAEKEKAEKEKARREAAEKEKARLEAAKKEEQAKAVEVEKPPAKQQEEQNLANTEGNVTYHTVQQGENLFRIALKYYGSQAGVEKIRQANGLAGNEISVGQTLTIPLP